MPPNNPVAFSATQGPLLPEPHVMDPLPMTQLERNFADIAPPLTRDAALVESSKCLFCHDAPCMIACPTHIDVPSFIKKIGTGNLRGSARVILDANPMGHSCARACPVEDLCEGACVLNDRDEEPIKIALLQRYATDYAIGKNLRLFEPGADTGKKVAIIGAGPAGLSCAQDLRRMGHAVTIFDAHPVPGGLNTYGIAEYKMRPPIALAEAKMVIELGVEIKSGVTVGRDVSFEDLRAGYEAVLVAVGLSGTRKLGIPGEDLPGAMDALSFIEHLKTHPYDATPIGRNVVVVGAGNTAIDAVTHQQPESQIPTDLNGKTVVIIDDVLFTGRTIRSALDAVTDLGRPSAVRLCVMVDRGLRELPIQGDYVGRTVATSGRERVLVSLSSTPSANDEVAIVADAT